MFEPTWESVGGHPLPNWYDDAKLGIFLHWGLYSVPGWAPQVPDIQQLLREQGPAEMLRNNPYAEWYYNTGGGLWLTGDAPSAVAAWLWRRTVIPKRFISRV